MTITLYTQETPNGYKISIILELLKVAYKTVRIELNHTRTPEFLKINPIGKIPAITDDDGPKTKDGSPFTVYESGAILLYLTDKYDKQRKLSYEPGSLLYYDQLQWLFFQNAGLGPIQGQLNHFKIYAPEKIPYGINRYSTEARKYYDTLNKRLESNGTGYVVGDHLSIVDVTLVGWVSGAHLVDIDIKADYPFIYKWITHLASIEEIYKGFQVPAPSKNISKFRL